MNSGKANTEAVGVHRSIVVALFRNQVDAERAIRELKEAGIAEHQLGVVMRDRDRARELAEGRGSETGEAAAAGALSGGILGGVVGLLAGVGALAIPGVGPVIAGGVLASALAGAGIGAAAGGLMGALIGIGIPEDDARRFERGFEEGGVLVTADAGERSAEAREILRSCGGDLGSAGGPGAAEAGSPPPAVNSGANVPPPEPEFVLRREEIIVEEDEDLFDQPGESWRGNERRYHADPGYAGPERRLSPR